VGALRLNGKDQYAVLPHERIAEPFTYSAAVPKGQTEELTVAGRQKKTVDIHDGNFLIEVYFRAVPGSRGGTLVSKSDGETGYRLKLAASGSPVLVLQSGGSAEELSGRSTVSDGSWHHLIVECDRQEERVSFYVDGRPDATLTSSVAPGGSLANGGDFYLGRGPEGDYFAGAVEFLRISRGTLADAKTTIEELYEWQFNGPQFRDFAGQAPVRERDAGAIEYTDD
jgi:hypothetical protein